MQASTQLASLTEACCQEVGAPDLHHLPITLVGFSKGGTVLNQFLAELSEFAAVHRAAPFTAATPVHQFLQVGCLACCSQAGGSLALHGCECTWNGS